MLYEVITIFELMDAIDSFIPEPKRDVDKPFLMPIEDVFSISGRGTVVTGRVERGKIHVGDNVEIVGIRPTAKTVCTGVITSYSIHYTKLYDHLPALCYPARW